MLLDENKFHTREEGAIPKKSHAILEIIASYFWLRG